MRFARLVFAFFGSLIISTLVFMGTAWAQQKTLILYSSIGMGHLSASRAIEEKIKAQDPNAQVELKNIRDFMTPTKRKIDEKLYWVVFKYLPKVFSNAYLSSMKAGLEAQDLADLKSSYNKEQLLEYIRASNATTVIATHYGSAVDLGTLKSEGKIPGIKTAWVHTDYIEHYFPRISQRLDKTFVGHQALADAWERFGVSKDKVAVTGIPVRNLPQPGEAQRDAVLKEINLESAPKTFVMSGGSEGLKDYESAVRSLAQQYSNEQIQIVAVCGKNEKARLMLEALAQKLPTNVTLKPLGFIPNKQLIDLISVSDLYVTKAGGLSPTEGALLMKPLVLINEYGGHEAENAEFFKRTGMAEIVNSSKDLGAKTAEVLANKPLMQKMMENQREYRNSVNLDYIANWAQSPGQKETLSVELGLKQGKEVRGSGDAIERLDKDFPAQVEVYLNYPKSADGTYMGDGKESNPFGHIAIRVKDNVYTVNHLAQRGSEPYFLHKLSVHDYFYTTKSYYRNEEFTGMQGQAYGRDSISVRLDGLSDADLQKMKEEIVKIEQDWKDGKIDYVAKSCNCADMTLRILKAGGVISDSTLLKKKIKMPLDVFDEVVRFAENNVKLQSSLIHYGYVKSSQNEYRAAGFPLSLYQVGRSIRTMFRKGRDPIESKVNAHLLVSRSSDEVRYERVLPQRNEIPVRMGALTCEGIF
ncbi:MGDG synthase family glycosyltransferase [Bdellovibrio sp. HCB2-146]|uniref:MGDG synthase family glycosyltransferase n=1 Tax=Bdellovibrio sp. HCB2-146 TaxID=3394362 RepID=UPI0039BCFD1E